MFSRVLSTTKRGVLVAVIAAGLAANAPARADKPAPLRLGESGQVVVSAAQILPILAYSHGPSGSLIYGDDLDERVYNTPRLILDYVVLRRLTIGTDVLASFTLGHAPRAGDNPSVSLLGVAPHLGYILAPNSLVAFWPRVGFTYYSLTEKTEGLSSTHQQLALSVIAQLVITPFPHLGVTMGPAMDLPISGKLVTRDAVTGVSVESPSTSFHVGFSAGLLVYF
jgi:hypothetical protein